MCTNGSPPGRYTQLHGAAVLTAGAAATLYVVPVLMLVCVMVKLPGGCWHHGLSASASALLAAFHRGMQAAAGLTGIGLLAVGSRWANQRAGTPDIDAEKAEVAEAAKGLQHDSSQCCVGTTTSQYF